MKKLIIIPMLFLTGCSSFIMCSEELGLERTIEIAQEQADLYREAGYMCSFKLLPAKGYKCNTQTVAFVCSK